MTLSAVDGYGPIPSSAETDAFVRVTAARQRRLLAVERESKLGERAVLERAPHQPGGDHRPTVVGERGRTRGSELRHLRQLVAELALADRGHEAGGHDRVLARAVDERAEDGGGVDDGLRVRHRENRAVAACRGSFRPGADRLLVLAPGSPQVDVRVDERGCDHERARGAGLDRRDHAVGDRDAQGVVDSLRGSDHAAFERERVAASVARDEHHATSACARASTGATVRTS